MPDAIDRNFAYHPPRAGAVDKFASIREHAKYLARVIDSAAPDSREKSLALTKLEESVMWANAAIARHQPAEQSEAA